MTAPRIEDLGHALGEARGVTCFATVEDSIVVLGPPRSGKGLHLIINAILDAPGGVITTSTRPDNLTACLDARAKVGPVAVFDPQGLAPGIDSATRWSPVRGCEDPHVAMVRAKALTSGAASGTSDANFWQASAEQAVRCLLHAAALARLGASDLYRWSLSAVQAHEAVLILASDPRAATSWHQALESIVTADQRQRDSVWAMVSIAFSSLADPRVLDALTPGPGEQFDPEVFLRRRGTVFLVGTSTGASATAGIVGAFVEDVAEVARRMAARSSGARIDPPLSMILDEAANYPLPSLTSLMSEGGGTGISTTVVLQSLAQARAVWGEHEAAAIWDAAILKVILGGGSNARDLDDLSRLIGQRDERQFSESTGTDGRRSRSSSTRQVPILDSSQLRMLPFGTAVLIYRSARPIVLSMRPWTQRDDATALEDGRRRLETLIQRASRSD
jgi:type IV secretory pathway TraG/TraD family ATPase VirD4